MPKLLLSLVLAMPVLALAQSPSQTLWYDKPAEEWTDALPVGNGRLGAMVYGHPSVELIRLNEHTLWTGGPPASTPTRTRPSTCSRCAMRCSLTTCPRPSSC